MITYNEFILKHKGKALDYDGVAGVQCVDLIKFYLKEVFNINAGAWGDAHAYFDNFNNLTPLKRNFTRISNTPSFVPKQGDIVVWSGLLNGGWGHIAIATGQGNTSTFYSYDQNWNGRHDPCVLVKHNYNCVLGVLRPRDQSKLNPVISKPAVVSGFKVISASVNSIKLVWNKVNGANGYIVYKFDTMQKKWVRLVKTKTAINTYTVTGLNVATTYKFAVKAYKTVDGKEILSVSYPVVSGKTVGNKVIAYTIKKGDTLGDIAKKYKTSVDKIVKVNGIKNPNVVYPGQVLKIVVK